MEIDLHFTGRLLDIVGAHDVVAVENRSRLVAGNHHGYPFRNAGSNHVPHCCPPEIVKEPLSNPGLFACLVPRSPEFLDPLAVSLEHIGAAQLTIGELSSKQMALLILGRVDFFMVFI